jgi:hypothetical protein
MARKKYTSSHKVAMVRTMVKRQTDDPNTSRCAIARDLGLDPSQLRKWQQQVERHLKQATRTPGIHCNPQACSLHTGRKSCLYRIEQDLLLFIIEQREQSGTAVPIKMVTDMAKELDETFRAKTDSAQYQVVRRFVMAHGLVHLVFTHPPRVKPKTIARKGN